MFITALSRVPDAVQREAYQYAWLAKGGGDRPPGVSPRRGVWDTSHRHLPRFGAIFMQASTRLDTDSTDFSNMARSAPFNWISTMRSTPFDPITVGTPPIRLL